MTPFDPPSKIPVGITYFFSQEEIALLEPVSDVEDIRKFMHWAVAKELEALKERQEIKKELEEEEQEGRVHTLLDSIQEIRDFEKLKSGGMIPGGEVRPTQPPPKPPDAEKRFKERAEAQGYRVTNLPPPDDDNPMTKEMFDADYNPIKAAVRMMRTMPKMLNWDEHDTEPADPEEMMELAREIIARYSQGEVPTERLVDQANNQIADKPLDARVSAMDSNPSPIRPSPGPTTNVQCGTCGCPPDRENCTWEECPYVTQEVEVGGKNEGDVTAGKGLEKPVPISVQLELDRSIYGVSFEEDGKRIDPEEVSAHPPSSQCVHNWVDIRNSVVESGEMCNKCFVLRPGNEATDGRSEMKEMWTKDLGMEDPYKTLPAQCSHPCLQDQKCDNPDWCRKYWCHLAHTEAGASLVDERSQDPGPAEDGPHAHPMGKEDGERIDSEKVMLARGSVQINQHMADALTLQLGFDWAEKYFPNHDIYILEKE